MGPLRFFNGPHGSVLYGLGRRLGHAPLLAHGGVPLWRGGSSPLGSTSPRARTSGRGMTCLVFGRGEACGPPDG
jgi:hypothetical protein